MAAWLIRATKQVFESGSPADMARQFGAAAWVDANGNAQTNALAIWQPDLSAVTGWPAKYWTLTGDVVSLLSQAQRDAVDAAELSDMRNAAVSQLQQQEDVLRAFMLIVLDEFNAHATKMNSLLTAIDNAASLAALKTAAGAISDHAIRTEQVLRDAIRNRLGT
jgi:soluble cytochrome b562